MLLCKELDAQELDEPDELGERSRRRHDLARVPADLDKTLVHEELMPEKGVDPEWTEGQGKKHRQCVGQEKIDGMMVKGP